MYKTQLMGIDVAALMVVVVPLTPTNACLLLDFHLSLIHTTKLVSPHSAFSTTTTTSSFSSFYWPAVTNKLWDIPGAVAAHLIVGDGWRIYSNDTFADLFMTNEELVETHYSFRVIPGIIWSW